MSPGDWMWLVAMVAACGGMVALARKIEPHRSSRDGTRFTCFLQPVSADGRPAGRWREGRAEVVDDRVCIRPRLFLRFAPVADTHQVLARSDDAPKRKAVFVLAADEDEGAAPGSDSGYVTLRLPATSPAAEQLDALVAPPRK